MRSPRDLPPCPACGEAPSSSLACLACGALLDESADDNHFMRLGLDPTVRWDADAAELNYLRLSRSLHPDFQRSGDADAMLKAVSHSALLNEARTALDDDLTRGEHLLELHDPGALDRHKQLSPEFLMEALELSEEIEAAVDIGCHVTLRRIASQTQGEIEERLADISTGCAATMAAIAHADDPPDVSESERVSHAHEWSSERLATLLHQARVYRRILRDIKKAS